MNSPNPLYLLLACLALAFAACDPDDASDLTPAPTGPTIIADDISADRTLRSVHDDPDLVDYLVTDLDWRIEAGLTIQPGVRIAFAAGARMYVDTRGYVVADGDPTQQGNPPARTIVFEGQARNPGHWRGIVFYSPDSRNLFHQVLIAHTGSSGAGISDLVGALFVERISDVGGQLAIVNTTIQDGSGDGLIVPDGGATRKPGVLRELRGIEVRNVRGAAMRLDPVAATKLVDVRGLSGNGFNGVEINGQRVDDDEDLAWPAIMGAYPYRVLEGLTVFGKLRLRPGVNVEMAAGKSIVVQTTGSFAAEGRSDAPITIVGETAAAGSWGGLAFLSASTDNRLAFCTVRHGGMVSNSFIAPALVGVATISGAPSFLQMADCTLSDSAGCGIGNGKSGRNAGTVEATRVTFANLAGANLCGS